MSPDPSAQDQGSPEEVAADRPIAEIPKADPGDPNSFENFKDAGVFPTKAATIETLELIRSRAEQLAEKWLEEKKTTREIALAYADLENDFTAMSDVSRFTAVRYDQVMRILPRLDELDELIYLAETNVPGMKVQFGALTVEDRKRRAEELKLLKSVVMKFNDIRAEARTVRDE